MVESYAPFQIYNNRFIIDHISWADKVLYMRLHSELFSSSHLVWCRQYFVILECNLVRLYLFSFCQYSLYIAFSTCYNVDPSLKLCHDNMCDLRWVGDGCQGFVLQPPGSGMLGIKNMCGGSTVVNKCNRIILEHWRYKVYPMIYVHV